MTLFSFQVDETTRSRLDRLAERRNLPPEEVAALALEEFVAREEWQIAEIEAAVEEADRGEFARDDEVAAVLSKYTAAPTGR